MGDHRAGAVGLLEGPLHRAVEHGLVPGRAAPARRPPCRAMPAERLRVAPHRRVVLDRHRLVVAAPERDRRVVAEQVDGRGRLPHGLLADAAGVAPLQREVLPEQQAGLVGRVVELGPGDVGVDPQQVEAGLARQLARRAPAPSGVASASAMRVGPWFEPLRKRRSPLTLAIHDRSRTWRSPVRRWRASDGAPPSAASSTTLDVRGRGASARPSARGHQSSGRSIVIVHSRSLAPAASGWSATWSSPPSAVCTRHRRGRRRCRGWRGAASTARSGVASRHSARSRAMRTGPVSVDPHRPPDAARVPVGVEAVPVLEDAGEVPLGGEVGWARAGDLDGEVVLAAGAQRVGDLEGVRGEVALGVAEVGAVEPHVALVEEPVEGQPRPAALGRARRVEASAGRAAGRRCRRRRGPTASGRAPRRPPTRCRRTRRRARCGGGRRRRPPRATSPRARPWSSEGTGQRRRRLIATDAGAGDGCRRPGDRLAAMTVDRLAPRGPPRVGQLRESGWTSVPVKEELRRNAIARIQAGEVLFPGGAGLRGHRAARSSRTRCSPATT